jgi:hypothetical protein
MGQGEGLIVRNHLPCPAARPLSLFCCHHVHFSTKHQMHSSVRVVNQTMSRPTTFAPIGIAACSAERDPSPFSFRPPVVPWYEHINAYKL